MPGDTFLENFLCSFWGFVCRQPPPANPSSKPLKLRGGKAGGFPNRGGSHFFSGKVRIVSQTLSGLFLVGAVRRPRKRKGPN